MALRTTADLIKAILGPNYDEDRAPDLLPFMKTANILVTRVSTCATSKGVSISSEELAEIEKYLAAHFYQHADPGYTSKATAGASGSFKGQYGMSLEGTDYGQTALMLDPSGCLLAASKGQRAGGAWLGKTVPDRLTFEERN